MNSTNRYYRVVNNRLLRKQSVWWTHERFEGNLNPVRLCVGSGRFGVTPLVSPGHWPPSRAFGRLLACCPRSHCCPFQRERDGEWIYETDWEKDWGVKLSVRACFGIFSCLLLPHLTLISFSLSLSLSVLLFSSIRSCIWTFEDRNAHTQNSRGVVRCMTAVCPSHVRRDPYNAVNSATFELYHYSSTRLEIYPPCILWQFGLNERTRSRFRARGIGL